MSASPESSSSGGVSQPSSGTPRSLLERAQADDEAAWDTLVALYTPLVFQWCQWWGLQHEDAADVLQEVFQAVATHITDFRKRQPGDTFRGWLRTITRNKVHDHFRRSGRQPEGAGGTDAQRRLAQIPAPQPPEDDNAFEQKTERALFHRALELVRGEFEERTWQAFWRTAVEERAPNDVAAELAMTAGAVRVAKSRVLQRLRAELGDLLD